MSVSELKAVSEAARPKPAGPEGPNPQAVVFLSVGVVAPPNLKLDLPHLREPITIKRALKLHPKLAELDGTCDENTLLHFYKRAGTTFVFQDADAEDEMSDLLGVEAAEFRDSDDEGSGEGSDAAKALSAEQCDDFRRHLDDIRAGIAKIK